MFESLIRPPRALYRDFTEFAKGTHLQTAKRPQKGYTLDDG